MPISKNGFPTFGLVAACVAVTCIVVLIRMIPPPDGQVHSDEPEDSTSSAREIDAHEVGTGDFPRLLSTPTSIASNQNDGSSSIETSRALDEPLFSGTEYSSITSVIERRSLENNWTRETKLQNMALWATACKDSKPVFESGNSPEELAGIDPRLLYKYEYGRVCADLLSNTTIAVYSDFLDGSQSVDGSGAAEIGDLRVVIGQGDPVAAMEFAAEILLRALANQDEAQVQATISTLAFSDLLADFSEERALDYRPVFQSIISEVSAQLICQELQGCIGTGNPFVLRQCVVKADQRGAFCLRPQNLNEAIYQTLTPVEFAAFKSMLNQINRSMREIDD